MEKITNSKKYDLEKRTANFARKCRTFCKLLLIRSSGSVAANHIEANESLSKKDYYHRVKICRKEAKESKLWLDLLDLGLNSELITNRTSLINEANELMRIFGSIISKSLEFRV